MRPNIHLQTDTVTVWHGDSIATMRELPDNSIDSIVTDPPYGLGFMGAKWDALPPGEDWARECLRVLKPGGHLLAFGGSRTWHRLAVAVEDAGFEVRDSIAWLYGSGFPKSLDVSKAIDKAAGAERTEGAREWSGGQRSAGVMGNNLGTQTLTKYDTPATEAAREWQGWGTALKPAFEPVVVGRKPLQGTVAQNVQTYGTGALNIDATRITADGPHPSQPTLQGSADSSRAGSTDCTCPEREDVQTTRSQNTPLRASSDASPAGHSDLLPSAREHASSCLRLPGSRAGYPSSPCSCGERAQCEVVVDLASARQLVDAPASDDRQPAGTHIRENQSKPCFKCTAGNVEREAPAGRWPANVVLDDTTAQILDQQSGISKTAPRGKPSQGKPMAKGEATDISASRLYPTTPAEYDDMGGASRFFKVVSDEHGAISEHFPREFDDTFMYASKAPKRERPVVDGVAHPTVKPLALMRWLVKLVTPPGGVVLDPFEGSGTTLEACLLEGFDHVGIEREQDYLPLIEARLDRQAGTLPTAA
jgi:site-specific DNA-methyltransferase (adenine-specific)